MIIRIDLFGCSVQFAILHRPVDFAVVPSAEEFPESPSWEAAAKGMQIIAGFMEMMENHFIV